MVPRERLHSAVQETIDTFQLRHLVDRRVDRMSMGQRQRLRIAMTFLPRPQVVLLDEPLTSLDVEGVELLREAIAEVRARDGAVLWCSPSEEPVKSRFDTRWTLENGRLAPA
jgi:ABC-type multidrug transport system ATPase subunit